MAPNPDRELAEARAAIDRSDERTALKRLDRARRGYLKQHDTAGLEHLLVMASVLDAANEPVRIGRNNLLYAVKQNLRQESRRRAQASGEWQDPYPDLEAPSEHTGIAITGGVKLAIAVGTALATVALAAVFVLPWFFDSESTTEVNLRLLNDTPETVDVRGCDDTDCVTSWMHREVDPGLATEGTVPADDLVDLFKVERAGREDECLPLRIHDAYQRLADRDAILVARLSEASPCPGTTVLPEASFETGL